MSRGYVEGLFHLRHTSTANPTFPGNYQRALEEFDRNDDGLIDFDEFCMLATNQVQLPDELGDMVADAARQAVLERRRMQEAAE